jgi:hypothetical protein
VELVEIFGVELVLVWIAERFQLDRSNQPGQRGGVRGQGEGGGGWGGGRGGSPWYAWARFDLRRQLFPFQYGRRLRA